MAALIVMGVDIFAVTYLPFCFKNIIENLELKGAVHGLLALVGIYAGVNILSKTASFLQDLLFFPVINVTIREFHYKTTEHVHNLSLSDYQKLSIPEVISFQKRIGFSARLFLRALLVSILPTFIKFIVAFSIIWGLDVFRLGLAVGILVLFGLFYFAMSWYLVMRSKAWNITDKVTMALGDSILNTKLVRFYKSFEMRRLRNLVQEESEAWFSVTMRMDFAQVFLGLCMAVITGGLIGMGAYKVHEGTLSLGNFILLNGQMTALFIPIRQTLLDLRQMFEASVDMEKITGLLSVPVEKKEIQKAHFNLQSPECIRFEHVTFSYDNKKKKIVRDLDLSIQNNQRVLIYGVSGVGKSTLLGLMTGLLLPQKGKVFLLGEDIRTLSLEEIGKVIHFIPQENQIFSGTFYDNLVFGVDALTLSEVKIHEALKAAALLECVDKLPLGLQSLVGEMGSRLSGGEKQRLCLARAILLNPHILIFDETTNAMDKITEKNVFKEVMARIPTIIFISHRSTAMHNVDSVLEVVDGQITEKDRG